MRLPSRMGTITLRSTIATDSISSSRALRASAICAAPCGGWAKTTGMALAAMAKIVGKGDRLVFMVNTKLYAHWRRIEDEAHAGDPRLRLLQFGDVDRQHSPAGAFQDARGRRKRCRDDHGIADG